MDVFVDPSGRGIALEDPIVYEGTLSLLSALCEIVGPIESTDARYETSGATRPLDEVAILVEILVDEGSLSSSMAHA